MKSVRGVAFIGGAVVFGFLFGFGIGQKTRQAAPGNVKTSYNGGTVTIEADVQNALKTGVTDYLSSLTG
jgi:hypothetical protein